MSLGLRTSLHVRAMPSIRLMLRETPREKQVPHFRRIQNYDAFDLDFERPCSQHSIMRQARKRTPVASGSHAAVTFADLDKQGVELIEHRHVVWQIRVEE